VWHTPGTGPARQAAARDLTPIGQVTELTWAPHDDLIAVTGIDMELSVWRLTTDHLERQNQYEPATAAVARWSPDGTKLAIADSLSEDVHVLGPDGEPTTTLTTGLYGAEELYWSPDSNHLAATTVISQGLAWLWDVRTGDLRHSTKLSGPTGIVVDTSLAWSPDNTNAVVAADGRLLVLSVDGTQKALRGPDRADEVARWTTDGIQVISSPPDRTYFQVSWATPAGIWRTTTLEITPWRIATSIDLTGTAAL
jgi:WD40 repeat protein